MPEISAIEMPGHRICSAVVVKQTTAEQRTYPIRHVSAGLRAMGRGLAPRARGSCARGRRVAVPLVVGSLEPDLGVAAFLMAAVRFRVSCDIPYLWGRGTSLHLFWHADLTVVKSFRQT